MNFRPIMVLNKRLFRQNRGRNLTAITAIMLTTLLFTTLFVLSQSMRENLIEMTFRQTGYDAQISIKNITAKDAEKIAAHPDAAKVGQSMVAGLGMGDALSGRQVEIRWADENYAKHSFAGPTTGNMPKTRQEIALDTIVLDRLGIPHELGQKVTLEWIADFTEDQNRVSNLRCAASGRETNLPMRVSPGWIKNLHGKRRRISYLIPLRAKIRHPLRLQGSIWRRSHSSMTKIWKR